MRCWVILLLSVGGCGYNTPAPSTTSNDAVAITDWRRALVGTWNVEFRLDSVRDLSARQWRAGSFQTAHGTLRLMDSTTSRPDILRSSIQVDFTALLGRPMSCVEPRPSTTLVQQEGERTTLRFTPNVADCGFGASGILRGDSLVGTWGESNFAGPVVMGRFRMVRARP